MQKLKLNFCASLIFILAIELALLVLGLWLLTKDSKYSPIVGFLFCLVAIPLIYNFRWLFKFLKGRVFFQTTSSLVMDGGNLTFDEPSSPYEVWLFCKIPFSRYHGQVSVASGSMTKSWAVNVPRRNPIFRSFRSDCTPIVLRPQHEKQVVSGQCCLTFHLRPTLINAPINEIFPADNVASITVMVKSA